jgi:hypothetical protein
MADLRDVDRDAADMVVTAAREAAAAGLYPSVEVALYEIAAATRLRTRARQRRDARVLVTVRGLL